MVEKAFVHPDFDHSTVINDIGLLKLETPMEYIDSKVQPVGLADQVYSAGTECTVTGWGVLHGEFGMCDQK